MLVRFEVVLFLNALCYKYLLIPHYIISFQIKIPQTNIFLLIDRTQAKIIS